MKFYKFPHEYMNMPLWEMTPSTLMDCHATARGSIPGRNGVFIELHVLRKGQ